MKIIQMLKFLLLSVLTVSILSCEKKEEKHETTDGIWQSVGYGRIVKIEKDEFLAFDVTANSCLPLLEGNVSGFGDNLKVVNDTLGLKDGINTYYYTRIEEEPFACQEELSDERKNNPMYNFEILANTFKDHYAYFELRNVNWDSLYTATKGKINSKISQAELYIILEDMLDSFNDGHIGLDAPDEIEDAADSLRTYNNEPQEIKKKSYGDHEISDMVASYYLKGKKKSASNKMIQWGILENNIGYLQVNQMFGLGDLNLPDSLKGRAFWMEYFDKLKDTSSEEHTKMEVSGVKKTMELVLEDLSTTDALVLDVRFNGGGKDEAAMEIIRHFNSKKRIVFSKKARFSDGYTKANYISLEASENPYTKPIYLLTSQQSASATEIMVLSSLLLENVTRIGAHTEGVFSDVLDKTLPNGWELGLSNEVYLDTKGMNYEGKGIPADINLGYPFDRQTFFRSVADDFEGDISKILEVVNRASD